MDNYFFPEDFSETVLYDDAALPVKAWTSKSEHFPTLTAVNHWHNDIELAYVLKGSFFYNIDGQVLELHKGQLLFINSGHMHFGFQKVRSECETNYVMFHPSIISSVSGGKYPEIMNGRETPPYLLFTSDSVAAACVLEIHRLFAEREDLYELNVLSQLFALCVQLLQRIQNSSVPNSADARQLAAMHRMTGFVQKNYGGNISVGDIAGAGLVCRSRCCEIFKKYLGKTPTEYLTEYRIHKGIELLGNRGLNITEISFACGFNSSSYFTETFTKFIGCAPTEYRKSNI